MKESGLMEILNYISANYASVNLKQLSARFNYSERQLQRIIMDATGISFRENIQNQKMQRAAVLLSGSDLSVASICEQTGYPSQNNFRKIFQRHYGMTPSEYRNQFRKPEN
jgi:transcriptional regulator GlxA family with amidase domain